METDQNTLVEEHSAQHLKDFKLAIEFKYLMKNAPGGVYLMPEFDDIRKLHGVIFLRRGIYRDGVFRFVMTLPKAYNSLNTHPEITFVPPIFNPLVDPITGVLDLRSDESLLEWQPDRHFIVTALTFLKKIFYLKSFDGFARVANEEARSIFHSDIARFMALVTEQVKLSKSRIHETQDPSCNLVFTEPKPAHDVIRDSILGNLLDAQQQDDYFSTLSPRTPSTAREGGASTGGVFFPGDSSEQQQLSGSGSSNAVTVSTPVASAAGAGQQKRLKSKGGEHFYDASNEAEDLDDREADKAEDWSIREGAKVSFEDDASA